MFIVQYILQAGHEHTDVTCDYVWQDLYHDPISKYWSINNFCFSLDEIKIHNDHALLGNDTSRKPKASPRNKMEERVAPCWFSSRPPS